MLRCRTLGALELGNSTAGEHTAVLSQPKRAALLVYLSVANSGGFHRRDSLLALFWPELDQEHARAALRQALTFLRHELGDDVIRTRGSEEVGVDPERLWCDAVAFDDALRAGDLERALELYRGHFLTGFHISGGGEFERWVEEERRHLGDRAAAAASALVQRAGRAGADPEAIRWARRTLTLKPDDEPALQKLVTLLDRTGDRGGALREYEAFASRLRTDYQTQPSASTRALIEGIREAGPDSIGRAPSSFTPAVAQPASTWVGALQPADSLAPRPRNARRIALGAGTLLAAVTAVLLLLRSGREVPAGPAFERTAIAVLPFQNLSAKEEHAYFAGGLHDEISTQLSKVAGLKVISRTSVMGYAGANILPLRQIASELGVGSVVEGSVQVLGGRLRVNVQLIDAATGANVWAERYDRTLDDAFAIQSDVAQQIVRAVGAALSSGEEQRLAESPTANPEAYRLYLQGREYVARPGRLRQNWEIAQQLYERALALDPNFALAYAALSEINGWTYFVRYDPSPRRVVRAREEAEAALRLAPDLPQAHLAMGLWHYWGRRDYTRALEEFAIALEGAPNDASLWQAIAAVHRRLGNWDDCLDAFEKAMELNPRDGNLLWDLGGRTYQFLHRYVDAVRAYDRALTLAPDLHDASIDKGWAYVAWQGQLDSLRAALNGRPRRSASERTDAARAALFLWERKPDTVLQVLRMAHIDIFVEQNLFVPVSLYAAWAHQLRGDHSAAQRALDSALVVLDSVIRELPDDWRVHSARGLALAGLGRRAEALREARWLRQSQVYREDAHTGPRVAEHRARILVQADESNAALDEIEGLLGAPSWLSLHTLQLDPLWDPIRDHPRFHALLAKHGT